MSYDLTVITLTGDRLVAFDRCVQYMERQTYTGRIQWIVVDDGEAPVYRCPGWARYIRLRPQRDKRRSFCINLRAALDSLETDRVLFFEDDDWYSPGYLDKQVSFLSQHEVVGEGLACYYNLPGKCYRQNQNTKHASLCSTSLQGPAALDFLRKIIHGKETTFVDTHLWDKARKFKLRRYIYTDERLCVGMKGLPGRKGIGSGHRPNNRRVWRPDPNFEALARLMPTADKEWYVRVFEEHFKR